MAPAEEEEALATLVRLLLRGFCAERRDASAEPEGFALGGMPAAVRSLRARLDGERSEKP